MTDQDNSQPADHTLQLLRKIDGNVDAMRGELQEFRTQVYSRLDSVQMQLQALSEERLTLLMDATRITADLSELQRRMDQLEKRSFSS